jgi:hypothetical protein
LARHERGSKAITGSKKKREKLHIIVMRHTGRMYTMDVSGRILLIGLLFALVFVVVSVLVINRYAELFTENIRLRAQLKSMTQTLDGFQYKSQVLTQYNQLVSELNKVDQKTEVPLLAEPSTIEEIEDPEAETLTGIEASGDMTAEETTMETEQGEGSEEQVAEPTPSLIGGPEAPENPTVDADKLSLLTEDNGKAIRFQYILSNIHPENKAVSGYLFIILANEKNDPPVLAPFPEVEMTDGEPAAFKKGTAFSIRHGKTVRGRLKNLEDADKFDQAWVFAYDDEGNLLMKKRLNPENG